MIGGTKRKASGAAAAKAAPDVDPLAVVPASLASVNSQHYYSEVQMWLEEILGNAILKDLEQAMPLDIANGGHMVIPFCHLFP